MVLTGTHGTCVSCADSIKASGFKTPTEAGKAGKGIYFWAHGKHTDIARKLAVGWHEGARRTGAYNDYPNKDCAILWAEIPVHKDAYLDFNAPEVEDTLNQLVAMARAGKQPNEPIDHELIHKVHEYVIESAEKTQGCPIDVIRARVPPPKKMDFIEKTFIGHPNCYVVRNGFERIKLVNTEHV